MERKLEQEELEQIKTLQVNYNKKVFELGSVTAQEALIKGQLDELEKDKNQLLKDLNLINEEEIELVKELEAKYGSGTINIETGTIS